MVKIFLNGDEMLVGEGSTTISGLIDALGLDVKKIAVEKDLEIIAPEYFSVTILSDGSRIEIVHFIGGG